MSHFQSTGYSITYANQLGYRESPKSPFVFMSERGGPFTPDSFNWLVKRAGKKANLAFQAHAHMLRHATGFRLAGGLHPVSLTPA